MKLMRFLLGLYSYPILGGIARQLVFLLGADIPRSVRIGDRFNLKHRGLGVVLHPDTIIEDDVAIFQGVTIGEAEVGNSGGVGPIVIGSRSVICAGAVVIAPLTGITVGRGSIVAANAVLTVSTGEWEVWAGVPAKLVSHRRRPATESMDRLPTPNGDHPVG